jgi:hypothetical protein
MTVLKIEFFVGNQADGERGKYATSNANRAYNPEHYTDEREKSEHEIIANV